MKTKNKAQDQSDKKFRIEACEEAKISKTANSSSEKNLLRIWEDGS